MADFEGAKNKAHEDAEGILKSADKKADEALSGLEQQKPRDGGDADAPTLGEKASDATEKTKANTGKAWESTKQGTSDAADATKEKAGQAKDETAGLLQKGGQKVQEAAAKAYDALDKVNRYETYQSKE